MPKQQILIVLSGKKQAGKTTLADFLSSYYLQKAVLPQHGYLLSRDGTERLLPAEQVQRFVKLYSFADELKRICRDVLGLREDQTDGSNANKSSFTEHKWERLPKEIRSRYGFDGYERSCQLTARELMQVFGTDIMRCYFGNVWAAATIRIISRELVPLAIVTDARFPDEIDASMTHPNNYVIRLRRAPFAGEDLHESETALDSYNFDRERMFTIGNEHMSIEERNELAAYLANTILERSCHLCQADLG